MNNSREFVCKGEIPEEIPQSIIESTGFSYFQAYTEREAMAAVAQKIMELNSDSICRLPLCSTVEAEALGGRLNIGNDKSGPRIDGYPFSIIEELTELKVINFATGRAQEVLEGIGLLASNNQVVALNIMGPFSVLALLINPVILFKSATKKRDLMDVVLKIIEDSLVNYAVKAVGKGARIISYADPTGALELVGPKFYHDISGRSSLSFLKNLQSQIGSSVIHLCWKSSRAFEKLGYCQVIPAEVAPGLSYGKALGEFFREGEVRLVGHRCMKSTPQLMQKAFLSRVELN